MYWINSASLPARMFVAIAVTAASSGSAGAQVRNEVTDAEIVVEAPRSVSSPVERRSYSGIPLILTTVKIPVFYSDLDLADPASVPRLLKRIQRVAEDACAQLDRLFPLDPDPDCTDKPIADAVTAANALTAMNLR